MESVTDKRDHGKLPTGTTDHHNISRCDWKVFLVGGAVRDALLGLPVRERDWVVVGAEPAAMRRAGYKQVGRQFPVFLHPQTHEEYALARTETKTGCGHTGFRFDTRPEISLEADLARRDFTINAMARDTGGTLIDPFNGLDDLRQRRLRATSSAFAEDPLRVLRGARFRATLGDFGFRLTEATLRLMQDVVASGELPTLPAQRLWQETTKALASRYAGYYFEILEQCGALAVLFPDLGNLYPEKAGAIQRLYHDTLVELDDPFLRLAGVFRFFQPDQAEGVARRICQTLGLSRARQNFLAQLIYYAPWLTRESLNTEQIEEIFLATAAFNKRYKLDSLLAALGCSHSALARRFNAIHQALAAIDYPQLLKGIKKPAAIKRQVREARLAAIRQHASTAP